MASSGRDCPNNPDLLSDALTGPLNLRRNPKAAAVAEPWSDARLDEGIALFNVGHHWHAHEAWESLWMGLEGDDKLFLQGLIMAAAMLVQYDKKVARGVDNHWQNVTFRLRPHVPTKWGIDVAGLLRQLEPYAAHTPGLKAGAVQLRRQPA